VLSSSLLIHLAGRRTAIVEGNVKLGYMPVILYVAIGGSVECIFVVLDTIVEPSDLFLEVAHLTGFEGFMLSNG
jgi:hypothetical protein